MEEEITHAEFMLRVYKLAEWKRPVRLLLEQLGEPRLWPEHLRQNLFKQLGIAREETIYVLKAEEEEPVTAPLFVSELTDFLTPELKCPDRKPGEGE